jgi:proline iminopeptidase
MSSSPLRSLYPGIEPYDRGFLQVSPLHTLYYEQSGNPNGKPVVFLHGGPGGGTSPKCRCFFDPAVYRVVLFDQRGCGQSTPHAELADNTTWDLVADIERVREHLGIDRWQVFGGSWGSTLSLAYAQTHPDKVTELVLRGIFMLRRRELEWCYQSGCDMLYPDAWETYLNAIPEVERGDLMSAYHRRLTSSDAKTRTDAARAWSVWEGATSFLHQDKSHIESSGEDEFALAFARIECHYFVHGGFFEHDEQFLSYIGAHRHIHAGILQGRTGRACALSSTWDLHRAWPEADLRIVQDAGHSAFEPGNMHELLEATDRFGR